MKCPALLLIVLLFWITAACRKTEVTKAPEHFIDPDPVLSAAISPSPTLSAPAPPPTSSALVAPKYRRAPEGVFFLLERVSVTTESGVTGFPAGTRVRRVGARNGDTLHVTDGTTKFDVPVEKVTDDVDLGALAGRRDFASQKALAEYLQGQRDAERQAREADKVWMDEQDRRVSERRQKLAEALAQRANPLDRGAYNQTYAYPYWYPYGYYYRYPIQTDRYGYHYWIDSWGGWHYVP